MLLSVWCFEQQIILKNKTISLKYLFITSQELQGICFKYETFNIIRHNNVI